MCGFCTTNMSNRKNELCGGENTPFYNTVALPIKTSKWVVYFPNVDPCIYKEKGKDLTQSCDKIPYTNGNYSSNRPSNNFEVGWHIFLTIPLQLVVYPVHNDSYVFSDNTNSAFDTKLLKQTEASFDSYHVVLGGHERDRVWLVTWCK